MGIEAIAIAAGLGAAGYMASQKKTPKVVTPGPPPAPVDGVENTAKKRKAYPRPAQIFKDEDLRLGAAGKLGL